MQKHDESCSSPAPTGCLSDESVRQLVQELRIARAEARRQGRRLRAMAAGLALVSAVGGLAVQQAFSTAHAQMPTWTGAAPMSPEERKARRAELLSVLPADARSKLEAFEREVDWLSGYMQTWDEGKAGAVVAMMLYRMAENMDSMPSMEQQMRTMGGQMGALPAIVAELNQINAKMHVITATMDSTMGRTGRMMPWMPFSP